jgi:cell division protein FtsZ
MIGSGGPGSRSRKVLVVGVGSGARRVMEQVHNGSEDYVDTLYVTTDEADLKSTRADVKFLIGMRLCGGKGAMGLTELGEKSAEDAKRDLEPYLKGYPLIVQIATLGKGTASGASHVIASTGEGLGALVINFLIIPSSTMESMQRTVANHTKNRMLKRNFNVLTIDQDRFQEINGNQPLSRTMEALDALLSWIVISLSNVIFGRTPRSLTISDLRSVFKEGNEGTIFVGGSYVADPEEAADEFISCGLLKRDPKTGRGYLLNLVTPKGSRDHVTQPFIDALMDRVNGSDKTVFIGNLEEPQRTNIVDLIGIITGMEDGKVQLQDLKSPKSPSSSSVHTTIRHQPDRWDIPMVR